MMTEIDTGSLGQAPWYDAKRIVQLVAFVALSLASVGIFFLMPAICAVAAVFVPARIIRRM